MPKGTLCVGGPRDGEYIDFYGPVFRCLEEKRLNWTDWKEMDTPDARYFIYISCVLRGERERFTVYAPQGWTMDQIVARLLKGYKRVPDERPDEAAKK